MASHIFFIRIEPRPNATQRTQTFRMVSGEVISRDDFRQIMIMMGTSPEEMQDWENDQRGDDTVQISVYCQGPLPHYMRWIWYTMVDGGAHHRNNSPEISRAIANNWEEKLMDIIDSGDVKRTEKHLDEVLKTLLQHQIANLGID